MRPVSAAFLRAVAGSHTMTARARLVPAGQTGTDPDGVEAEIVAGDVKLSGAAKIRGTLDLTTSRSWPASNSDPLAPYGGEVFVERGIQYGNGTTEWVSLGYFRLEDVEQRSLLELCRLSGSDRMAGLIDAQLLKPVQFAATDTRADVVDQLVREVYPDAVIEWDDTSGADQLGRRLVADQDRHGFLEDVVTSAGKTWAFDHRGALVIRDAPDPAAPVAELAAGPGGVLITMSRALSRTGVYNAVVATGDAGGDSPVRGVVVDSNPDSPTYFYGPFGPVPRFYSSPLLRDDLQAIKAASTLLSSALGVPYNVDLQSVPNPALEPLDPVSVVYPATARSLNLRTETHVLDEITFPLTPAGALTAKTREQTVVQLGELP